MPTLKHIVSKSENIGQAGKQLSPFEDVTTIPVHGGRKRIRRMFKRAASEELLPGSFYRDLQTVSGLQRDRTAAREPDPVPPVSDQDVEAALAHLPEVVADMARFQRVTGCRPSEVCTIRPCDVGVQSLGVRS